MPKKVWLAATGLALAVWFAAVVSEPAMPVDTGAHGPAVAGFEVMTATGDASGIEWFPIPTEALQSAGPLPGRPFVFRYDAAGRSAHWEYVRVRQGVDPGTMEVSPIEANGIGAGDVVLVSRNSTTLAHGSPVRLTRVQRDGIAATN